MDLNSFKNEMNKHLKNINIILNEEQMKMFYTYMDMLIEKNKVMNLTAIIEPSEIILKHFVDSLTIAKYLKKNTKVLDVGTGAGFPGIPLKIQNNSLKMTLLDSLNKRICFLGDVIEKSKMNNIVAIHGRAEEYGQDNNYREQFDYVLSRAVAPLNVLMEYMIPFLKVGGTCISMKGKLSEEELQDAKKAIETLGGSIEKIDEFKLSNTDLNRTVVIVKKTKNTPHTYPRNPGTPTKKPL